MMNDKLTSIELMEMIESIKWMDVDLEKIVNLSLEEFESKYFTLEGNHSCCFLEACLHCIFRDNSKYTPSNWFQYNCKSSWKSSINCFYKREHFKLRSMSSPSFNSELELSKYNLKLKQYLRKFIENIQEKS